MGKRRRDEFQFVSLRNAQELVGEKVNVFATIAELGFPKLTNRTDPCLSIRVIDDTHIKLGMSVDIITRNAENLLGVAAAGDLIQLTEVKVELYNEELILVFDKLFSSFALYKGEDDDDFVPYQFSSNFNPGAEDKKFIAKLRKWMVNFQFHEDPSNYSMLREIKEGHSNLACEILHCWEITKDEWCIFVWDGTDAPPNTISAKLEDELSSPLPLQLETLPLPRELLCTMPTVGTILRITFDPAVVNTQLLVLNIGKWVKLVNMSFQVDAGLWHGVFTPHTKLQYTPNEDTLIMERQRLCEDRIRTYVQSGSMPSSCGLPNSLRVTEDKHESVLPVTLMFLLTHSEVTAKFKCLVRVVAVKPCEADSFLSPDGRYRMELTLEDPTARVHAFVVDEDGETLFGGYPDDNVLTRKLNRLLGVTEGDGNNGENDAPRNPPWVIVCLKTYYVDKADCWGSRHIRMFDTKIAEA